VYFIVLDLSIGVCGEMMEWKRRTLVW